MSVHFAAFFFHFFQFFFSIVNNELTILHIIWHAIDYPAIDYSLFFLIYPHRLVLLRIAIQNEEKHATRIRLKVHHQHWKLNISFAVNKLKIMMMNWWNCSSEKSLSVKINNQFSNTRLSNTLCFVIKSGN